MIKIFPLTTEENQLLQLVIDSQTYQKQVLEQKKIDADSLKEDSRKLVRNNIKSEESAYFIAKDEDIIVGYVLAEMTAVQIGQGWLNDLFVVEDYRKQGIAKKLIEHAETWLKTKHVTKLTLSVHNTNAGAISLYESLGYQKSPIYYIELTKDLA